MGPQEEVSPNSDLRHKAALGSRPAQRIPDSHGGSSDELLAVPALWMNLMSKPRSRHRMSAVLCTPACLQLQKNLRDLPHLCVCLERVVNFSIYLFILSNFLSSRC